MAKLMTFGVRGACLLWLAIFCGCTKPIEWKFTLGVKNGNAVLDMTGVTFIFLGEIPDGGASGTATIWSPTISVNAISSHSSSIGSGKGKFDCQYAKKAQTMTFRGHTIVIKDAGQKVEIDGQPFDLTGKKKTFLVPKTGKVTMRDFIPDDHASAEPPPDIIHMAPTAR